jgi:hypothetical protein
MPRRVRTKKSQIKYWIYNGDNGPEVYELDEHGRLKDEITRRRIRGGDVPKPTAAPPTPPVFSMDARTQALPDSSDIPSSVSSSIGAVDASSIQIGSNHTQSVDFAAISEWFTESESESTLNTSSSTRESESQLEFEFEHEIPDFCFDLDPDFIW